MSLAAQICSARLLTNPGGYFGVFFFFWCVFVSLFNRLIDFYKAFILSLPVLDL